jgi:hypothetical protein
MSTGGIGIAQQADAILAAHHGVVSRAAVAAMQAAISEWIEAGARTDIVATPAHARRLLHEAADRLERGRGIG